jgi:hypothetical protein
MAYTLTTLPTAWFFAIVSFLNRDDRWFLLALTRKKWRTETESVWSAIVRLDNGPHAKPIVPDGSALSLIQFYLRESQFTAHLYTDVYRVVRDPIKSALKKFQISVAGATTGLALQCDAILGKARADRLFEGMDDRVEFCDTHGRKFNAPCERMYIARVTRLNRYEEKAVPQHYYPGQDVIHSPLSIVPDTNHERIQGPNRQEEQIIRDMEGRDHRFKVLYDSLRMWDVFCDDMVRFGLPSIHKKVSAFVACLTDLQHPFAESDSMIVDEMPAETHIKALTEDQGARLKAILEPLRAHKHVAAVLNKVDALLVPGDERKEQ